MLEITFAAKLDKKVDNIGLFVAKDGILGKEGAALDKLYDGALTQALEKAKNFKGKEGQILSVFAGSMRLVLVGLGDVAKLKIVNAEKIGAKLAVALEGEGVTEAAFQIEKIKNLKLSVAELAAHIAHGAQLRLHRFEKYKTKKKKDENENKLGKLTFVLAETASAKRLFDPLQKISEGVFFARDLALEPANVLDPETFAAAAQELKKLGVKVTVLDQAQMEKLGMGSLLSVSKGSDKPPRLVSMLWEGAKNKKQAPVALIGKGVTFDTGGISLKPPANMWDMKYDMCGAAAVIGAMKALAGRKAKANVVGLIGLVENMPSGKATRPGDIVTSASGQTIEVQNTDAEGRLVLADVLWYAQKHFKPRCLVDLATLTGAMNISLGQEFGGLFSNQDTLAKALSKAGEEVGEKLWRLPLAEGYDKLIDSPIADMKNIGGPKAGSCTAAQFLQRFVNDGMDWAHLDIAGVAYDNKESPLAPKGPTAFGVRLLDHFIAQYAEK